MLRLGGYISSFVSFISPSYACICVTLLLSKYTFLLSGLYISFLTPGIAPSAISVMSSIFPEPSLPFPLLVSANVLDASDGQSSTPLMDGKEFLSSLTDLIPGATPVLGWSTYHGMDKVWNRIENDQILREFQTSRIVRVVEHLYSDPENIPKEDVRFVELLQKKLERTNPSSFTELVVGQLVKAIQTNGHHKFEKDPFSPRYASKPPRKDPVRELLPEYYLSSSSYAEPDIDTMMALVRGREGVGFTVRAGMVVGQDGVSELTKLIDAVQGGFIVVITEPADREDRDMLKQFVETVGSDNVIVSLNKDRKEDDAEATSEDIRIPQPRNTPQSSDSQNYNTITTVTALVTFFIVALL